LEEYLKLAPNITDNRIIFKMIVASRNRLIDFKKDPEYCKWLNKEHIGIDEVHLSSLEPTNIGYFEELVPDPDTLSLHTIRLRRYLPKGHPRFQLLPKMLYDNNKRSAKVIMAKCDPEHYEILKKMFQDLHDNKIITVFQWKEFLGLNPNVKSIAVHKQIMFNRKYRSVRLVGFKDNEDNIPMKYKPETTGTHTTVTTNINTNETYNATTTEEDPLTNMLVSDYIGSIQSGNGTFLFRHVYEPVDGQRDTLVHIDNYTEALEFAKVVIPELAREMSYTTKSLVIEDQKAATEGMTKPKWQPFTKAAELMAVQNTVEYMSTKRTRLNQDKSNMNGNQTQGNQSRNANGVRTAWNSTLKIVPDTVTHHDTQEKHPTWEEIQLKIQENVEASANKLRVEFQATAKAANQRITIIDNKLEEYSDKVEKNWILFLKIARRIHLILPILELVSTD
jgi:hypothetical protein